MSPFSSKIGKANVVDEKTLKKRSKTKIQNVEEDQKLVSSTFVCILKSEIKL